MTSSPSAKETDGDDARQVAAGAGMAFLGRLGAMIELVALPVYAWLYGTITLGIFASLWTLIRILTAACDMGMTTSLQRFVPAAASETGRVAVLKAAVSVSFVASLTITIALWFLAPVLAKGYATEDVGAAQLVGVIHVYIWTLPLWTMVEVLTSSVRARRRFGPEIRIRIFYEQLLRLIAGVGFFYLGFETYGLFFAHIISIFVAMLLAGRLAQRFYNMKLLRSARLEAGGLRNMLGYAVMLMPANLIRQTISDLPVQLLSMLIPGNAGAQAAAVFFVGRRFASVLQVVRQSFDYVVAPFASMKHRGKTRGSVDQIYAFSTRLSLCLLLPPAALVILLRQEILLLFRPEFTAAAPVILVLALGRVAEAATGPSKGIVEMIGARFLPVMNSLIGVAVLIGLQLKLVPLMGVTGAAFAAAAGINTVSWLSLLENMAFYECRPYKRELLRPLGVSVIATGVLGSAALALARVSAIAGVFATAIGSILAFAIVVRYGLQPADVSALGKLGEFLSRRPEKID